MFNFNVVGFKVTSAGKRMQPEFEEGYHASGHASGQQLLEIIETINPKVVIPVHTEHPEFFVENVKFRVLPPKNGQKIDLTTLKDKS